MLSGGGDKKRHSNSNYHSEHSGLNILYIMYSDLNHK